jgi:DNA-binding MarR family transcriptional regulator
MVDLNAKTPKVVKAGREEALRDAIELFYFAYRAFTGGPDEMLTARGLGRVHHRILYFVGRNPQIAVNALLEILAVSKQALNAPLRQLVEEELIVVRPDEQDRRFKRLSLTPEGKKLEAQLTGAQMKLVGAVFDAAGSEAEAAWKTVMRVMAPRAAGK